MVGILSGKLGEGFSLWWEPQRVLSRGNVCLLRIVEGLVWYTEGGGQRWVSLLLIRLEGIKLSANSRNEEDGGPDTEHRGGVYSQVGVFPLPPAPASPFPGRPQLLLHTPVLLSGNLP